MMFFLILIISLYGFLQLALTLGNCDNANPNCILVTIQEMGKRVNYLKYKRGCDHNAVFARTYQIMTQYVANSLITIGANRVLNHTNYFENHSFMSIEDRVFDNFYFNASDYWTTEQKNQVPKVWQIAFQAADNRELSAIGNVMLGINAHINRVLPYVMAKLGLTFSNGTSAKPDYDLLKDILAVATDDIVNAIASEFDPSVLQTYNQNAKAIALKAFVFMRSLAWNNSEKLVHSSPYRLYYNYGKSGIENDATAFANSLRLLFKQDSRSRDSFCRSVHGLS